jgi:hypothetical protein
MDTIITKLSDFMSVDMTLKFAVSFHPIVFIVFLVLIQEGFALRKFLDYNELNNKHQFTITRDFVNNIVDKVYK